MGSRDKFPFGFPPNNAVNRRTSGKTMGPRPSFPVAPAVVPRTVLPGPTPTVQEAPTPPKTPIRPPHVGPILTQEDLMKLVAPDAPDISVIFGTYNRINMLKLAVESIRRSVGPFSYEIVITDGGSTDGSREWLAAQKDVVLVGARCLEGAVKAFNQAWSMSRGRYIANFNDDAEYVGNCLECGAKAFSEANHANVGQIAFDLNVPSGGWDAQTINGFYYANFGLGRRDVVQKICEMQGGPNNYWNPIYHTYAADCEHSCWVWKLGYRVLRLETGRVRDKNSRDGLRAQNESINETKGDGHLFWSRWPSQDSLRP